MRADGSVETSALPPAASRRLAAQQTLTVVLLFAGYASYSVCLADFSVAIPMLIEELHGRGLSIQEATVRLGAMASIGVLGYAIGKFLLGGLADFWGGRRNFIAGLGGATFFTVV